jgi:hypothetical protein
MNKSGISNLLSAHMPRYIHIGKVHVDTLIGFTYPRSLNVSPQLIYYGEKYSQLKLVNI